MKSAKFSGKARLNSFRYAFRGLWTVIREEHNLRIHLVITAILIPSCILLHLSALEWALITICIALVLGLEFINSAIERISDKISPGQDPDIGKIKDIAAAAVLIAAVAAIVVGLIILIPKLLILVHT